MFFQKLLNVTPLIRGTFREGLTTTGQGMQIRSYSQRLKGFRGRKNVRKACKPEKIPKIPVSYFHEDFEAEPFSGSAIFKGIADDRDVSREFIDDVKSLTARGFNRFQKEYEPPENVRERFISGVKNSHARFSSMTDQEIEAIKLDDPKMKYDILVRATNEFNHSVPNSLLQTFPTIGAVIQFYETPVTTSTPYDELVNSKDLPPNMHVQKDPVRFTPETAHYFGGISAFPKDSTIITSLRAKQKYQAYKSKKQWP